MNARIAVIAVLAVSLVSASAGAVEAPKKQAKSDSLAPFPHRIVLLNEEGNTINPAKDSVHYSPAQTCGKCHDYPAISKGWHFNARQASVPAGRPGEPWIMLDEPTRTQIPLSNRAWAGTFRPADAGLNDWQFVRSFARHMPGGGVAETPSTQPADPKAYWPLSGKLQNDCMICHDGGSNYSTADRELQLKQMNFKFAATKAMGLAKISGSVQTIVDDAEAAEEDPLKSKQTPKVAWNTSSFDAEFRASLNISRASSADKCYYCHMTNQVGPGAGEPWQADKDVHLAAGLTCADCHRHGTDHAVVRGYEAEGAERKDAGVAALSCRGCHMGAEAAGAGSLALGGRLGAPRPLHNGIPPVHFERLSCTSCHSGPWPGEKPAMVQTALAHELGLESFERNADSPPRIAAPIFLRSVDDKITPHKAVWPNFWGRLDGEEVTPIPPTKVKAAAKDMLKEMTAGGWGPLSDELVGKVLAALAAAKDPGQPVYVSGGKLYRRSPDGKVTGAEHPAAKFYAWPLAHDVRPAAQSLGVRGCSDCHTTGSPIHFAKVSAQGPVAPANALTKSMYELRGDGGLIPWLFALSFMFRMMLKVISFSSAAVLTGLLVMYGLRGLTWLSSRLQ